MDLLSHSCCIQNNEVLLKPLKQLSKGCAVDRGSAKIGGCLTASNCLLTLSQRTWLIFMGFVSKFERRIRNRKVFFNYFKQMNVFVFFVFFTFFLSFFSLW